MSATEIPTAHHPEREKIAIARLLHIQTVLMDGTLIIEDDGFALGMPTPAQMLRQHARLVEVECEQLRYELERARENIEKLVAIHQDQAAEITKLNARIERMTWELSDALVENTELKNRHIGGCPDTWGAMPPKG
ncbi:hypothetical protein EXN22_17765 [Pseudomonas tructae]|uniref:Uncharacterized protein n=1 Tax=Pseudomonas tructae TaxID=2518644 RepID=A0A411MKZ1_9PSED|nr:hypothetical protein [Pseudomonas tructae]QBF27441.1 hypothetical protein EXN22_17765 [Pseudomonas tructae]